MFQQTCVSVAEAERMIDDADILLLDMRDFRAYLSGHHPRAIHLNDQNLRALLKHSNRSIPVLICCEHGHRSQDMVQLFRDFGFTSCYSLDGGYEAWFPQQRTPQQTLSLSLQGWLLARGFDPHNLDARAHNNETALMQAAREARLPFCRELVLAGASPDLVNCDGNNALWMACMGGDLAIVRFLLANDINFDNQNDHGATVLMYAASLGRSDMVELLVQAGADVSLRTRDDFTALEVAASRQILLLLARASGYVLSVMPPRRHVA